MSFVLGGWSCGFINVISYVGLLFVLNYRLYSSKISYNMYYAFFVRYHFDGSTRQFFEGWYFKVSIPEKRQSFCFMYSVENPAFRKPLTPIEEAKYGRRFTGVGAQILGADDKYICQFSEESQNFWGSKFLYSTCVLLCNYHENINEIKCLIEWRVLPSLVIFQFFTLAYGYDLC